MNNIGLLLNRPEFYIPFLVWSIFWKGWALWKSANKKHLVWFILLLLINTFAILEIVYIFYLNRWSIDDGKILNYLEKKFKRTKK